MNDLLCRTLDDNDKRLNVMLQEYDDKSMPIPSIELEPHLLISQIRKHYLEYMIKLLSVNYENHQKLLGKNIYLPSAIWRCAKSIENIAAQRCMMVELYRRNITQIIKEVKSDIKKSKLNKRLLECLQKPPDNEKKVQTTTIVETDNSPCSCSRRKRKAPNSTTCHKREINQQQTIVTENKTEVKQYNTIPVVINNNVQHSNANSSETVHTTKTETTIQINKVEPNHRLSIESTEEDQVMLQLEQLFGAENEAEDDLFDTTLCPDISLTSNPLQTNKQAEVQNKDTDRDNQGDFTEQAAKIKSLDERLAMLEHSGVLSTANMSTSQVKAPEPATEKRRKPAGSKWLCEAYYQKLYLFEKLDEIRDSNYRKHLRIKDKFYQLFGEESEDDDIMSPLEETQEFVLSCKERIAPWIVKLLTPYYVQGRIRGKALFKLLAKHLIRLIYQCSHYPSEYEVTSFVTDFLETHKLIRCEADFKEFRIENI